MSLSGSMGVMDPGLANMKRPTKPAHFSLVLDGAQSFEKKHSWTLKTPSIYSLVLDSLLCFSKNLSWRARESELVLAGLSAMNGSVSWTRKTPVAHYDIDLFPKQARKRPKITMRGVLSSMRMGAVGHFPW